MMSTSGSTGNTVASDAPGVPHGGGGACGTDVPDEADGAAHAKAVIAGARERIDTLDAHLVDLLRRRMEASADVQQARMTVGGPRLSLNRELDVLNRYRDGLGRQGGAVAMAILELSRGQR